MIYVNFKRISVIQILLTDLSRGSLETVLSRHTITYDERLVSG
jgi:hypothetical protein